MNDKYKDKYNKLLKANIDLSKLRVSYLDIINLDKDTTLTSTQIANNYRYIEIIERSKLQQKGLSYNYDISEIQ